jgi:uncharacterized protein YkwD
MVASAAVVGVLLVPSAGSADPHGALTPATELQVTLVQQVNSVRARHGLSRLRLSTRLAAAANAHSVQMARLGYFSHDGANGVSYSRRMARYYPGPGYHSWSTGENLLWSSPNVGATRAIAMWLSSPGHREILLSSRWRELGLSAVHSTGAPGVYGGSPVTIVTGDFGSRSR